MVIRETASVEAIPTVSGDVLTVNWTTATVCTSGTFSASRLSIVSVTLFVVIELENLVISETRY